MSLLQLNCTGKKWLRCQGLEVTGYLAIENKSSLFLFQVCVCLCPHGLADSRELSKARASLARVPANTISTRYFELKLSQAVTEPDRCGEAAISQFNPESASLSSELSWG